jgi:deoxycytidine triphosphate deaminase
MDAVINPYEIVFSNYISGVNPENIQPNSIDLTVASVYTITGSLVLFAGKEKRRQLPEYVPLKTFLYEGVEMFKLEPGSRYQIEFNEFLDLPGHICGLTLVRSSMAKSGCTGENGLFDSGYKGPCGMMVSVQEESYIEIGASIAQILFFSTDASKMYTGFYQGTKTPMEWV